MRRYWAALTLFVSACAVWTLLFLFFHGELTDRTTTRTRKAGEELAAHLSQRLESRMKSMKVMATVSAHLPNYTQTVHNLMADAIMKEYRGFYSINWADEKGVIRWVYPVEPNRVAINKDLMIRPELAPVLELSRATRDVTISSRIMTYQGFFGLTVYAPIIRHGQFHGWINVLVDYTRLLDEFFDRSEHSDFNVQLRFSQDKEPFYTRGSLEKGMMVIDRTFPMFNQTLEVRVGSNMSQELRADRTYFLMLFLSGILILLLSYWALVRLMRSEKRLLEANRMLVSKNTLVSALSHDLANSVMVLNNNLRRLQADGADKSATMTRLERTVQSVLDMLVAVRNLHVDSLAKERHELAPVHLVTAVEEASELVRESAEKKQISLKIAPIVGYVQANRVTLVNCVILNVLKNAIKFSPQGAAIDVLSQSKGNEFALIVRDNGVGIEPEQLRRLFLTLISPTTVGTDAESGSGLGLFQVKYFMEAYGGRVEIESDPQKRPGTTVSLWFRRSDH